MKRHNFRIFAVFIISLSIPVSLLLLSQKTTFINRAYFNLFGKEANLVVNLSESYPLVPSWRFFAQGGEEKDGMLGLIIQPVARLKPEYIRIDHIYDFYGPVKRNSDGLLTFDWTKLDSEIAAIRETGAKPFISLSYMPQAISSGSEVDIPVSWTDWENVVRATIEHISGSDNLAIPDVYYEVWNEPDLFGRFKLTGVKNYLTLYYYAERGARGAENVLPFKFGGPATTGLYKNWFNNFFAYAQKNNLRVDFYSWHRYSRNVDDYEKDITNAWQWILNYIPYANTEFIITESGHDSDVDVGYDNNFSAIHTLALFADTNQKIPKLFVFELKDGPGPKKYWGRWGLLTHERFGMPEAKPRYRAIEFLNNLAGNWLPVYGQGTWVKAFAASDGNVVKTLVVNYDPYEKHIENVPLTFNGLPSTSFIFKRVDFMGQTSEVNVNLNESNWSTRVIMQPNSAAIFEIIPLKGN